MTAYKTELAHSHVIKRMSAAHARVRRYAKKKLANYVSKPAHPKVIRTHAIRPRYTRQQIMDRFKLLCGDLPGSGEVADKLLQGTMTPIEFAENRGPYIPADVPMGDGDGVIPSVVGPDAPISTSGPDSPPSFGGTPPLFGGGGPGGYGGNGGNGGNGGTGGTGGTGGPGGTGGGSGTPTTPVVPVAPVPEPGSLVLVLTGAAGAFEAMRRRLKA